MLTAPLTLVLGAGSSRDFGASDQKPFPLGDDLREQISAALNIQQDDFGQRTRTGSRRIYEAYRVASKEPQDPPLKVGTLVGAGRALSAALPGCESIDDYLERHTGNRPFELAGKLGIADCILAAERSSPLRQNPDNIRLPSIDPYRWHWLSRFLQTITKRRSPNDVSEAFAHLRVVNFNYDRCFEWFTHLWLRHVYNFDESKAFDVLAHTKIIHPYGCLGTIGHHGNHVPFGSDPDPDVLLAISNNIQTYSESIEEDNRPIQIREMTGDCGKFVFVGFAFHPQNMELLDLGGCTEMPEVFATIVGMPAPRWEIAQTRLRKSLQKSRSTITVRVAENSAQQLILDYGDRW